MGKGLVAAGGIPEARKVAETARKVATTTGDRNMATNFTKQIDYKVNHPQEGASAKSAESDPTARDAAAAGSTEGPTHLEGQITELLCGNPPQVLLTLTTGADSLLLHVADIAKISIQDGATHSRAATVPCSQ